MTYKNLKVRISSNEYNEISNDFDLVPMGIKSKLILGVGKGIESTTSYLSSIMKQCGLPHARLVGAPLPELKDRFIPSEGTLFTSELARGAQNVIRAAKRDISNEELLFLTFLSLFDGSSEYLLAEVSESFYTERIAKSSIIPHAVIILPSSDASLRKCIDLTVKGVKNIVAYSDKSIFVNPLPTSAKCGAELSYCFENNIVYHSTTALETRFFYFSQAPYTVGSLDIENIKRASLAIESARAIFSATKAEIYVGLSLARLFFDFEIYSLEPLVILKVEHLPYSLPQKFRFKEYLSEDLTSRPDGNSVFCGSAEYIERVRTLLNQ